MRSATAEAVASGRLISTADRKSYATARSVSCSERTAHRSAESVMDDDRQGTDERATARKTGSSAARLTGPDPSIRRPYDVVRLSIMLDLFSLGSVHDLAR